VGSVAARGKIGCEQGPSNRAAPQGALKSESILEQGKKSRPDPFLVEKGRRWSRISECRERERRCQQEI